MATVTVHTGNYSSYLYIDYTFNVSGREWTCDASLKLQMGPSYNFDAWASSCGHNATLRKDGSSRYLAGQTITLVSPTRVGSGTYNTQGTAPTVNISWAWNVNSSWGGYQCPHGSTNVTGPAIGPAGTNPSGFSITYNSSTWNSINATSYVQDWGGVDGRELEAIMVTGSSEADFDTITSGNWANKGRYVWRKQTTAHSETFNMLTTNVTTTYAYPADIKGMRRYYLAAWANNSSNLGAGEVNMTARCLPPAPGQITYVDPGGTVGSKTYQVSFSGIAANNVADYTASELTRTVRYKVGNSAWVYVEESEVVPLSTVTSFNVVIPADMSATVEGWMNYRGNSSESVSVVITNSNAPVHIYGSIDNETVETVKWYAPIKCVTNVTHGEIVPPVAYIDTEQFANEATSKLAGYIMNGYELRDLNVSVEEQGHPFLPLVTVTIDLESEGDAATYTICRDEELPNLFEWGINFSSEAGSVTIPLSASYDTYKSGKIAKIYGSVDGVARKVFEDV